MTRGENEQRRTGNAMFKPISCYHFYRRAGGSSDRDRAISAHIAFLQFSLIGSASLNRWNPIVGSLLCSQQHKHTRSGQLA
jgi:hypothetical protein